MKYLWFALLNIFLIINFSFAQIITTNPLYPVATQSVVLTFDAANTALAGYTGDIYAHTGVNLTDGRNWQHVIGSWGNNATQPKLTRVSTNIYTLDISPSANSFYSVGTGEVVKQIAIVFRSSDGLKQTADLTVEVFQPSNSITILKPDSAQVYSPGETIELTAVALFADSVAVYVNDVFINGIHSNNITEIVTASISGKTKVKFEAMSSSITISDSTSFFVRNPNTIADLPASNLEDGINYIDNNTVTLVLYAPNKQFAFLKSSVDDWKISLNNQMNRTPDEKRYWITLSGLSPAQEYGFQYVIDGSITVPDAYADKILDPWNDRYINSTIYPNLMPYPEEKTSGVVSVFQTAQTPYIWQTQNFVRPEKKDLVIYELHIRDFSDAKSYQLMIDTVQYFKRLGVNAVELMPVNEFEGNSSWGYNPDFYFAPDKAYGPKNKLKELIDTYHANGIAVIMDIVLNHSYGLSPLVQMYYDDINNRPMTDNPWYNVTSPNTAYSWGFDFNHESPDTKRFATRVMKYWLTEYRFDGFRFDFTKGFTNKPGDGWAYDQSRINILKSYADSIWTYSPGAYDILEHLTDNSEETVLANYGIMLWGNMNYSYGQAAMGFPDDDFSWISYKNRTWNNPNLIGYMESHDEERMMYRNLNYGQSNDNYNIKDTATALKRTELAAAFFLTVPGPKMIWQFEELGYDTSINYPDRIGAKPILWNYAKIPERMRLFSIFQEFIKLKKELSVFKTSDFTMNVYGRVKQIILQSENINALVIGNFDIVQQTALPAYPATGTWYDYFNGKIITNTDSAFILNPGEYHFLTDKYIGMPSIPAAPFVQNLTISGKKFVGDTLSATYQYLDVNNDPEGNSTFRWYSALTNTGLGAKEIEGANSQSCTVSYNELNKYVQFEITPTENSENMLSGEKVRSAWYGPLGKEPDAITGYPVPFRESLFFNNTSSYKTLTISGISGKIIAQFNINNQNQIEIPFLDIEVGLYFAKFEGMDNVKIVKILKY